MKKLHRSGDGHVGAKNLSPLHFFAQIHRNPQKRGISPKTIPLSIWLRKASLPVF